VALGRIAPGPEDGGSVDASVGRVLRRRTCPLCCESLRGLLWTCASLRGVRDHWKRGRRSLRCAQLIRNAHELSANRAHPTSTICSRPSFRRLRIEEHDYIRHGSPPIRLSACDARADPLRVLRKRAPQIFSTLILCSWATDGRMRGLLLLVRTTVDYTAFCSICASSASCLSTRPGHLRCRPGGGGRGVSASEPPVGA
jgi:hypothetical protein